jgi:DNA-directed RNA polymerase subunit RPC12/RpoP
MMYLPFKCLTCNHDFTAIDEQYVTCPNCKSYIVNKKMTIMEFLTNSK